MISVGLTAGSLVVGLAIGILLALLRLSENRWLSGFAAFYCWFFRGTPLLVQLFFLYFGLPKIGIKLSGEACAVIGLAFLGGAYMAESLRSGLEAVDRSQREAGECLGLTRAQNLCYVILPQALATAVPSLCANVIFLLKETSVFSAVALADLMYVAKDLIGMYYSTYESLLMLAVAYLVILLPISLFGTWLERRFDYERR